MRATTGPGGAHGASIADLTPGPHSGEPLAVPAFSGRERPSATAGRTVAALDRAPPNAVLGVRPNSGAEPCGVARRRLGTGGAPAPDSFAIFGMVGTLAKPHPGQMRPAPKTSGSRAETRSALGQTTTEGEDLARHWRAGTLKEGSRNAIPARAG